MGPENAAVEEAMRRAVTEGAAPSELHDVMLGALQGPPSNSRFIIGLKVAFPTIPLREVNGVELWHRIGTGPCLMMSSMKPICLGLKSGRPVGEVRQASPSWLPVRVLMTFTMNSSYGVVWERSSACSPQT